MHKGVGVGGLKTGIIEVTAGSGHIKEVSNTSHSLMLGS